MNPPRRENADELRFRCIELLRDFNHKCCENAALRAKLDAAKSLLWMAERYAEGGGSEGLMPKPTPQQLGIEEDGDEIVTPIPKSCRRHIAIGAWGDGNFSECGGKIVVAHGNHECDRCGCSYGPAKIEGSDGK